MVKEWSRNSQGHLEFKILIFFLQNEIEDALGRILNTINRYLHAKMCEKQCKTCIFALARSFLLDRMGCDHSKFVSERALPDYEKKFTHLRNLFFARILLWSRNGQGIVKDTLSSKFGFFFLQNEIEDALG